MSWARSFIHGRPPQLWALIEEAGLTTYERGGDFLELAENQLQQREDDLADDEPLEALKTFRGPDCSFANYLARFDLDPTTAAAECGYIEGFNAADATQASALALGRQQQAEDAIEGDRVWRIVEGYDRLPRFLAARAQAAGAQLHLNAAVRAIDWDHGAVNINLQDGRNFNATQAVITLPLGVLQAGSVAFDPEPEAILNAAQGMRMGAVLRFTLEFAQPVWPANMSFLLTPDLNPSVWWTAHAADPACHPATPSTLTGWTGGPRALPLLALGAEPIKQLALTSAATAFNLPKATLEANLRGFHLHDWQADPAFHGSYSWVAVNGLGASAAMTQPLGNTLFFAGEHTDTTGHWGTVHAAYGSGLRAAQQILA